MNNLPKTLSGFLFKYGFKPYAKILSLWIFIFIFSSSAGNIFYPISNKWFIAIFEKPIPADSTLIKIAIPTIILITVLLLLQSLSYLIRDIIFAHWKPRVQNHLSQVLNDYVNSQSMGFFSARMPGKINSQINYVAGGFNALIDFLKIFTSFFIIIISAGMVLVINKWVAAIVLFSFVFRFLYAWARMKKMSVASKKASESSSSLAGRVMDSISNFSIIKLFASAKIEKKYLESVREISIKDRLHASFMQRLFYSPPNFVWDALFGVTLFLCVILYSNGEIKVSEIVFTLAIYEVIMNLIGGIINTIPNLVDVLGSAQQSYKELVKPIDINDAENATELNITNGAIEIKNVTFKYNKKKVLDNLSLKIAGGEKIGLVGSSGAGKTTLVNLLLRLYDTNSGTIYFDGQNIRDITQDSLRRNITFIPQDTALFNRSIMENIAYGHPDATLKQVRAVAAQASADDFIMEKPKKYDSIVGDRGIKLSGGQKQRVAIARAFLKNAPILILDEATSALDSETENVVQKSFEKLSDGRTTIVIAHRLSTLQKMDRVVFMEQGKIIESGSHKELLKKKNGRYAALWKMQVGGFITEDENTNTAKPKKPVKKI